RPTLPQRATPAPTTPTLSLHDAPPIYAGKKRVAVRLGGDAHLRADGAGGAGHVLHQIALAELLAHQIGPHPRRDVRTPTRAEGQDRKSTRLNSSHVKISYAVICLKKKT